MYLINETRQYLNDPDLIVQGFHLFSFNDDERTEKRRVKTCEEPNR